jgi:hypothetical protein
MLASETTSESRPTAIVRRVGRPALNHRHHRDSRSAVPYAEARAQAGQGGPPRAPLGCSYRAIQHRAEQEYEQGIAQRRVLEEELIAAEGDDRGRREPQPSRPPAAADREEEEHRREEPQAVLHDDDQDQMRADPVEQAQEHRIANRPDGVRPQRPNRALEVDPAVGVSGDRRAPNEQEVDPQQRSHAEQRRQRNRHAIARNSPRRLICGKRKR